MIECKQIISRGARLFDGKNYFTINYFVNAYHLFNDTEWNGEPVGPTSGQTGGGGCGPRCNAGTGGKSDRTKSRVTEPTPNRSV
ncbi:MAG: hypothetical protein P8M25_10260 [Paracoccaceae bacterium]|nr:hypothetical protein [Paracoccaceae bacterium]